MLTFLFKDLLRTTRSKLLPYGDSSVLAAGFYMNYLGDVIGIASHRCRETWGIDVGNSRLRGEISISFKTCVILCLSLSSKGNKAALNAFDHVINPLNQRIGIFSVNKYKHAFSSRHLRFNIAKNLQNIRFSSVREALLISTLVLQ